MKRRRSIDPNLVLLTAVFIAVRGVFSVPVLLDGSRSFACTDADTYHSIAVNLLAGNGFSIAEAPPCEVETTVTPAYPFFLAGIYSLSGESSIAAVLIQQILVLSTMLMLYFFLKERFNNRIAMLGSVLFTVELNLALFSTQLTTETLFTFLFIPFLILCVRWVEELRWTDAAGAGLLLGAATLTRPVVLYFGVPLLLFIILSRFKWKKLLGWGVIVAIQLAVIAPWVVRNYAVFGEVFYSTVSDMNLVRYHAAPLKARLAGISREQAAEQLETQALAGATYRNAPQYFRLIGGEAKRYLLKHPLPYVGISALGGAGTLLSPFPVHEVGVYLAGQRQPPRGSIMIELLSELGKGRIFKVARTIWDERLGYYGTLTAVVFLIYALFHLAKLALGLRAFIVRGLRDPVMLLFLLAGIYSLAFLGLAVVPRLRVPVEPLLVSLAAIGLFSKREKTPRSS